MRRQAVTFRSNVKFARQMWGQPPKIALRNLRALTDEYSVSVAAGDLQFLDRAQSDPVSLAQSPVDGTRFRYPHLGATD